MTQAPKLFVLDTNVILHDAGCIRNFEENDIAIPITVLEELDRFKKGHDDIHFQAREFLRSFDRDHGRRSFRAGGGVGAGAGVDPRRAGRRTGAATQGGLPRATPPIIASSTRPCCLKRQESHRQVVLVTKDTNLRMKAKALGVTAQDYTSDKVESVDTLYSGKRVVENMPSEAIDAFYNESHEVARENLPLVAEPQGQRELHSPQRLEIGAGRLSARAAAPS